LLEQVTCTRRWVTPELAGNAKADPARNDPRREHGREVMQFSIGLAKRNRDFTWR
jgi:hypothetical protein